jgi:hypothetical protein
VDTLEGVDGAGLLLPAWYLVCGLNMLMVRFGGAGDLKEFLKLIIRSWSLF